MRLHIATHHSLSMDAYHQEYGTTEIVTRKFRCELPRCNSEMKFCRQNIYAHMKDVHKITLNDYEAQIGVKAKDIVPVEEMEPMDTIGQNHMAFLGHTEHGGMGFSSCVLTKFSM